ncbi:hypothetical protein [Sneathiella limimaris]|uniref:hypothetical protein n=1 Tax=Sneathiella limimaris TaxID=1964213 RepID=UPI00146C4A70|nr:hypothetical protein [Sneathiella limimaris]
MFGSIASKAVSTSVLALAMALSVSGGAEANSSRSNASQVLDVTLSQPGINFHVRLKNVSKDKHISKVNIQPESDVIKFPLKGLVKCAKDKSTDFIGARAYFGSVKRIGKDVFPINSLYDAKYHPSFSEYTGLVGGWITEGGNADAFEVPLSAVQDGHPALRVDPVALFNEKLQAHMGQGGSKLEFLKKDQIITVNRPISLVGTCREATGFDTSVAGSGYETTSVPVTIFYQGDPNLKGGLQAAGLNGQYTAPFQVTEAKVVPHVKDYVGQCPVDLKFRLSMKAQGAGKVNFRLVNEKGIKSKLYNLTFSKSDGGNKTFDFIRYIEDAAKDGISKTKLANSKPKGDIKGLANKPSQINYGSWKVELVAPNQLQTPTGTYSWKCEAPKGPTQLKLAPNPQPKPAPMPLKIKQAPEPKPMQIKAN